MMRKIKTLEIPRASSTSKIPPPHSEPSPKRRTRPTVKNESQRKNLGFRKLDYLCVSDQISHTHAHHTLSLCGFFLFLSLEHFGVSLSFAGRFIESSQVYGNGAFVGKRGPG